MRLIQFYDQDRTRRVGVVRDADTVEVLAGEQTVYALARQAIGIEQRLEAYIAASALDCTTRYTTIIAEGRLLAPVDHPDPAHLWVTGTGLTHLGSADARDQMHKAAASAQTDSMRMFQRGLEGGKPAPGQIGSEPEWFFKGDGSCVTAPCQPLVSPSFGLDGGEEPEMTGLYIIADDGTPYRLGFALGNEFSDHVLEKQNYLLLAHSKLRPCSFGPELLVDDLPYDVQGTVRILRDETVVWEKPFLSGEANMSHTIANLEHHHFKYAAFRRPGDVHAHFFGTATLSFAAGIRLEDGDIMEITVPEFGRPLYNAIKITPEDHTAVRIRMM